jgi:hypothetical protein
LNITPLKAGMTVLNLDDLQGLLSDGDFSERKAFICSFNKEIQVTGDKVNLKYKIPVLPQGGTEEIPVLSIDHYSGEGGI